MLVIVLLSDLSVTLLTISFDSIPTVPLSVLESEAGDLTHFLQSLADCLEVREVAAT